MTRLKDVVAINARALPETTDPEFEFKYIDIGAVSQGQITVPDRTIDFRSSPSRARRLAREGAVVVSTVRPYLKAIASVPESPDAPLVFSTGFAVLEAVQGKVDPRFLAYLCQSDGFVDEVVARSTGVSYPAITASELAKIPVDLPSLDQQRRIAGYLDEQLAVIDSVRRARLAQISLLAEKEAQYFGEATGAVPSKPLKRFGAKVGVGIVIKPAKWYAEDEGIPAIRGTDVSPGRIRTDNLIKITPEGQAANAKSVLRAGDVVVVRTGKAGAAAVVPAELDGANSIDVLIVRPGRQILPEYLAFLLNSERAIRFVAEFSVGSLQAHFNVGTLLELPVPDLTLEHQRVVVESVKSRLSDDAQLSRLWGRQLELVGEHRNSLISSAVAGHADVTTMWKVA